MVSIRDTRDEFQSVDALDAFDPFSAEPETVAAVIASDEYRLWLAADHQELRRDEARVADELRREHAERFGGSIGEGW